MLEHQLSLLIQSQAGLADWLKNVFGESYAQCRCEPLSGDASFRRYFRLYQDKQVFMLAIAPPATEKNKEFVAIAQLLHESGVLAPQVLDVNYEYGFILQQDLGDQTLQPLLMGADAEQSADLWYGLAIEQLLALAKIPPDKLTDLPVYNDALLLQEMHLFTEWFLPKLLQLSIDEQEQGMLNTLFACLIDSAHMQPQVFVHRDYHCRNLMAVKGALATIDFQDAVLGPITYDAVSIFKDCYIVWPDAWVEQKLESLYRQLLTSNILSDMNYSDFQRRFHLMGLQRHIKVLGIFARLSLRDGKHGYLSDLPTVVRYVSRASGLYPETSAFNQWFDKKILPVCKTQSWWCEE